MMWNHQLIVGSVLRNARIVKNGNHLSKYSTRLRTETSLVQVAPYSSSLLSRKLQDHLYAELYFTPQTPISRSISLSFARLETASSKVEVTVKSLKKDLEVKQASEEATKVVADATTTVVTAPVVTQVAVKKSLKQRIWDEVVHYYHGFRLLGIDTKISCKLLWRILNGTKLTRRENRLLVRTTSDLFRLVPFSVFIIVPFMELLLPVFIKFFPGMLPSTFQTAKDRDEKLKQNLKVKLEMAKFLQKTLDEMTVQHKDHRSEAAKEFSEFVKRTRDSGETPASDEILKFSKLFEDELTLDSLNRQQLMAVCRVLEVPTLGTNNFLRFQLQLKLRSLTADDKIIQKEGVESLNLAELQAACKSRGMRAYGMSEDHLRLNLNEWINLSLTEKVPPSLLLLSRAMMLPEHIPTSDKLKATISALPEEVVTQTRAAIGEREGKIDNRTKIEIIQDEVRKIKEEMEEEKEKKRDTEMLEDKAPVILESSIAAVRDTVQILDASATKEVGEISSQDLEVLSDALGEIAKGKKKLLVEKEDLKDLKEEIADYAEDVKELHEVMTPQDKIMESKAAKMLHKKVDNMIGQLDKVLADLELKEKALKTDIETIADTPEQVEAKKKQDELIHIDELMIAIKNIQKVDDDLRLQQIHKILGKLDDDHDGHIKVDDVLKVIETIAKDNVHLNEKQFDELIKLMEKEEILESERKIQAALENEMKQKQLQKLVQEKSDEAEMLDKIKQIVIENSTGASATTTSGTKPKPNETSDTKPISTPLILEAIIVKEAVEKQQEQLLPKISAESVEAVLPPPLPTATESQKNKTL